MGFLGEEISNRCLINNMESTDIQWKLQGHIDGLCREKISRRCIINNVESTDSIVGASCCDILEDSHMEKITLKHLTNVSKDNR